MGFEQNLQSLRKRDKITQEELADRLGVSRQSVSKWETGEAYPETDKLIVLCDMFGVSLDDLVRGDLTQSDDSAGGGAEAKENQKRAYAAHMHRFSKFMALGVMLVLTGVAASTFIAGFSFIASGLGATLAITFSIVAVLVFVAAATGIFVYQGINHDAFCNSFSDTPNLYGESEKKEISKKFAAVLACLISGILLDVIFLVVMTMLVSTEVIFVFNSQAVTCFIVAAFFFVLAFLVCAITFVGIKYGNMSLSNSKLSPKNRKLSDAICGAIMMTASAVYLIMGFVWGIWHPGWVIFPIGALLCGVVNTVLNIKDDD